MTDEKSEVSDPGLVSGGLDEPAELEPEQGTLALDVLDAGEAHPIAEWEAGAAAVLRKARRMSEGDPDADVWTKLTKKTLDGIPVTPLGTPELLDGVTTSGRPGRLGAWDIRAHVPVGSTNEEVKVDLEGGVNSLVLDVDGSTDFAALLQGVFCDLAPIVLDAAEGQVDAARAFLSFIDDASETGDLHPGTNLGGRGDSLEEVARLAAERGVLGVVVDGSAVHDRGASDAQELAAALAEGVAYLRRLVAAGHKVEEAAGLMEFRLAATDEQFPTIAKLRAARRLWARVLELSGVSTQPSSTSVEPAETRIHAVTSRVMMSSYDPYVNMLRTTVAAFAAGVGGADAITVLPFDAPLGRPQTLGRRIARNTSALLISESHVAAVTDPAGGAYAVEKLTDDLAIAAWEEFGRIESEGGTGDAFDQRVAAVARKREELVAKRSRPITGLTEFPNLAEELPEREATGGAAETVRRYGAAFEDFRDNPPAAPVFLATLGPVAAHTARATFATNLFAAGGISVEVAGATDGVAALTEAYGGQKVVCLAGADPNYEEWGPDAAAALREAGAEHVIIAGKPTDYTDDNLAMGIDALDFLTRTRRRLA